MRASRSQAVVQLLQQGVEKELDEVAEKLREEVLEEMRSQLDGDESENAEVLMRVHLRYDGTDTPIPVALSDLNQMSASFEKAHRRQFGFVFEGRNLVVEAVEVEAVSAGRAVEATNAGNGENKNESLGKVEFFSGGEWLQAQVRHREALGEAEVLVGPALLVESHQTVVVEPGWQAQLDHSGCLVLRRVEALKRSAPVGTSADPILLEVFNNLFMSIAEQMGVTLQNTAHSVNIKERLDFLCGFCLGWLFGCQCTAYASASGVDGSPVESVMLGKIPVK